MQRSFQKSFNKGEVMKKRDLILDFTSLLDVTLIVIFFFVLFSHLDMEANKAKTEEEIKKYEYATEEANNREEEASNLVSQLEEEIEIVKNVNARTASNVTEILNFNRNDNLKVILDMSNGSWSIRVIRDGELIGRVSKSSDISSELLTMIQTTGIKKDQTILCDFSFDGSEPGTRSAYNAISDAFVKLKKEYHNLYISETDLSIGKEE